MDRIIDFASESTEDLKSAATVAKGWTRRAQHNLFQEVRVHLGHREVGREYLEDMLAVEEAGIKLNAKTLVVRGNIWGDNRSMAWVLDGLADSLGLMTGVVGIAARSIRMRLDRNPAIPSRWLEGTERYRIVQLELSRAILGGFEDMASMMLSMPNLVRLSVWRLNCWDTEPDPDVVPLKMEEAIGAVQPLTSLDELTVYQTGGEPLEFLASWLRGTSIKTLGWGVVDQVGLPQSFLESVAGTVHHLILPYCGQGE